MVGLRLMALLIRTTLDELPGHYTPIPGASLLCAVPAVLISVPMIALMSINLPMLLIGVIVIGTAAQAAIICPGFLLPPRCDGGLHGALSGIGALVLIGLALSILV